MSRTAQGQLTRSLSAVALHLDVSAFLSDRQAQRLSVKTVKFYADELRHFIAWLEPQGVRDVRDIGADVIRRWLVQLSQRRNAGGVHASYRAIRAFMRWVWQEYDLDAPCPIAKVRAPKRAQEILEPVSLEALKAMLATCRRKTYADDRDRAIIMTALDTGLRASELCALDVASLDAATGALLVRRGKGGKSRVVFLGAAARREVLRYLRHRPTAPADAALFATAAGGRLTYGGLRSLIRRRAQEAGVKAPSLHSFRRAFALMSLRNGADVYSLQKLMGHADLTVLRRYLAQTDADLRAVHERTSPASALKEARR